LMPDGRWMDGKLTLFRGVAKAGLGALLLGTAACSVTQPVPSPVYDGYYAGVRVSDRADACGISQTKGKTSARVSSGRVAIPLFTSRTEMTGTVGEDGSVRASGIWPNPTGGFPGMTVLNGTIRGNALDGTASDFRCHTEIHLRKDGYLAQDAHLPQGEHKPKAEPAQKGHRQKTKPARREERVRAVPQPSTKP
jgi:hypothetical protein